MAFDQVTPESNPEVADFPSPIYSNQFHVSQDNIESQVVWWLEQSFLTDQIIVGIPTYARTWRMTSESRVSGIPPIVAGGPGAEGLHTRTPERRTLSYAEVCSRFTEDFLISPKVSRVVEVHKKTANYGYLAYNLENRADGIWIGHEDPESAATKASYVIARSLGGIAIFDLPYGDVHQKQISHRPCSPIRTLFRLNYFLFS